MAYATRAAMLDRFGERELIALTDRSVPPSGAIEEARLTRALTDAEARINGYLATRYALPLATVPDVLIGVACDLTRYALDSRPSEVVRQRYEDAIAWLRDVAAGKVAVAGAATQTPAQPQGGVLVEGDGRTFDGDTLREFLG